MVLAKNTSSRLRARVRTLPTLYQISALLLGAMLVTGLGGCLAAAFLPLAINAAEGVGSAVTNVTLGAVVAAHQGSEKSADQDHPGESETDREDRCEELQDDVPSVIELRKGEAGAPQYRELQLSDSLAQPQWTPIVEHDTDASGWRPAVNFIHMDFAPPLAPVPQAGSVYLAYRSTQSDSEGPQVEFVPLNVNFGKTEGTFHWKGASYEYALASTLPCFSTEALKSPTK